MKTYMLSLVAALCSSCTINTTQWYWDYLHSLPTRERVHNQEAIGVDRFSGQPYAQSSTADVTIGWKNHPWRPFLDGWHFLAIAIGKSLGLSPLYLHDEIVWWIPSK